MPGGNDGSGRPRERFPSDESGAEETSDVREAFALLGHEIRLDILLALISEWRAAHTEPRSYSELMGAVGMEDSGKFNYHLSKLRGAYVRKVEDGYVPTAAATALYRTVLGTDPAGESVTAEFEVGKPCPDCCGELRGEYEGDFLSVVCTECGSLAGHFTYPFPVNGLAGRTDREVLSAVRRRAEHHISLARSGQCPFCAGTTTATVLAEDLDGEGHDAEITCDTCTFVVGVRLLFALSLDRRVAAALVALDVPVTAENWELPEPTADVLARDPLRVALAVETDAGSARIVVDGDLAVESVTVDGEPVGPE